jgi:hypothetical protein
MLFYVGTSIFFIRFECGKNVQYWFHFFDDRVLVSVAGVLALTLRSGV